MVCDRGTLGKVTVSDNDSLPNLRTTGAQESMQLSKHNKTSNEYSLKDKIRKLTSNEGEIDEAEYSISIEKSTIKVNDLYKALTPRNKHLK